MRIGLHIDQLPVQKVPEAVEKVREIGLSGIEIFDAHILGYEGRVAELEELLTEQKMTVPSVYFNSDDFLNPEREEELLDRAERILAIMQQIGSRCLVVNGGPLRASYPDGFTADQFSQMASVANALGDLALRHGMIAALHPHLYFMVETYPELERLIDAGLERRKIGICPHAVHQHLAGADPYAIYEELAEWVTHLHMAEGKEGDGRGNENGEFFGRGVLDQDRLLKPLLDRAPVFQDSGSGWMILESSKRGVSVEEYTAKAVAYITEHWSQIEWEG